MKNKVLIEEVSLKESKALRKIKKYIVKIDGPSEFDSEYTFLEDTIIKHMIFKDKVYTTEMFKEILKSEESNNSLNLALNFISYQFRSEKELVNHLKEKGVKTEFIAPTIEKLKKLGYIDDNKFALGIIDSYSRKLKGPNYCIKIMNEKSVSQDIINLSIESYTHELEVEKITEIVDKEIESLINYPIKKQKMKLTSKLISSGFRLRAINQVLSEVKFVEDSEETLKKDFEKLLKKHGGVIETKTKQKIIASLLSKGYEYHQIKKYLNKE